MAKHLTQKQRYYICLQKANFITQKEIATRIGVSESTISKELKRNSRSIGNYDSDYADKRAGLRRSKASRAKVFSRITLKMEQYICSKLKISWSPEQISGRMKIDIGKTVCHETIYSYIRHDRANKGKLYKLLAHHGKTYRAKQASSTIITNRIDISQRPKIVELKTRVGDFEIDTVVSARNTGKSCLFTMVDRRTKLTFIRKSLDKSALQVQLSIEDIYLKSTVPILTLTSDNGSEFANHVLISENIGCDFYFARPYHSCDRGLNQNTNGLIRRYLPKGTNFDTISESEVEQIQDCLNNRPRKSLRYKTPNEVMNKYLQRVEINKAKKFKVPISFHS